MITLDSLGPQAGAVHKRKRIGRGEASGCGKTAGKGHKGKKARSGGSVSPGFEGGQMPIYRRMPKRGFKNPFRQTYGVLNVDALEKLSSHSMIDIDVAKDHGMVRKRDTLLKILGSGTISSPVTVVAHAASASAVEKITAAGGKIRIIGFTEEEERA